MLTEDYIMRMINQALAVLLTALGLKKAGQLTEALETFDQAIENLLGLNAHLAKQLDDRSILEMLTFLGKLDLDRTQLLADIYREEADVYEQLGQPENKLFAVQRSLRLYLEITLSSQVNPDPVLIHRIEELRHKLVASNLHDETRLALLDYLDRLLVNNDDVLTSAGLSRINLESDLTSLNSLDLNQPSH